MPSSLQKGMVPHLQSSTVVHTIPRMSSSQMPAESGRFQPTRWSMVRLAGSDQPSARKAMEELFRMYWFPLYAWCRARGKSTHDAEDLIQGFFLQAVRSELFQSADPAKGKLRTFLLTALQRYVRDESDKASSAKRGGGNVISIDPAAAEACYAASLLSDASPEEMYDRQWALTVLDHAMGGLEKEFTARGKRKQFHAMRPFLTEEGDGDSYAHAAEASGMTAGAFKVAVHRLRMRFRDQLQTIVRNADFSEDSDPHEELAYLAKVLARG